MLLGLAKQCHFKLVVHTGKRRLCLAFDRQHLARTVSYCIRLVLLRVESQDLHIDQLLERVERERRGKVVEELLLTAEQGIEEAAQVLVDNVRRSFDASQVVLQLPEFVLFSLARSLRFFVQLQLLLHQLELLLFSVLKLVELRAGLKLLLALGVVDVALPKYLLVFLASRQALGQRQ